MKQPTETKYRWYMANKDGMVTLCADQADAEQEAKDSQELWPHMGPHRAVQLRESSGAWFTAADMATAAAQGFRDGVASVAASAGSEPVAHLWQHSETGRTRVVMPDMVVDASATWLPVGPLYLHPSPQEGAGWKWVPKILSAEMVDAWASARLQGGIAQMTDDEANRAVAQANWDSMIAAAPPPPATSAGSGKGE